MKTSLVTTSLLVVLAFGAGYAAPSVLNDSEPELLGGPAALSDTADSSTAAAEAAVVEAVVETSPATAQNEASSSAAAPALAEVRADAASAESTVAAVAPAAAVNCNYETIADTLDTPEYRAELVGEMIEVSKTKDQLEQMLGATSKMMADSLAKSGKSEQEIAKATQAFEKALSWDSFGPVIEDIYARTYSAQELSDLNQFYTTTAGQALIEKTPELSLETQKAMMQIIGKMQAELAAGADADQKPAH